MIWSAAIDLVRALVFAAAHLCGNSLGGGILAVSLVARLALLPITLRAARRMMAHQASLTALAPEIKRLRLRHSGDRTALARATVELHQQHGIPAMPSGFLSSTLIQRPIGGALYRALATGLGPRNGFLWMSNLARPDALVAATAAALAGVAAGVGPSTSKTAIAVSMAMTALLAWRLSASVGLYWVASNSVGVVQSIVLRRSTAGEA